jgi:hypothetical protein
MIGMHNVGRSEKLAAGVVVARCILTPEIFKGPLSYSRDLEVPNESGKGEASRDLPQPILAATITLS